MIPDSFVQDLLARVDIVDIIDAQVPLKKSGANYFACCPFHDEKSASFSVSPAKQFYHCFGCGAHGSAIGFLMALHGMSFIDAIRMLAERVGMRVPDPRPDAAAALATERISPLLDACERASNFYRKQLASHPHAIAYLKQRGLSGEIAARFGIGYAPPARDNLKQVFDDYRATTLADAGLVIDREDGRRYDRFRNRITFPIHDRRGRIIGFGARIIDKGEPKYLNSPETPLFEKGRELYGLYLARDAIRRSGCVFVVEGYMDVVALAQCGIDNAVAALGTATTSHHIGLLLRQSEHVVFCFDGDNAGRKAAWRALENALDALRDGCVVRFLMLPDGHDPDSFVRAEGADAFRQAARGALTLSQFFIDTLAAQCNLAEADERARFLHLAQPHFQRIKAPMLQSQLCAALAERAQLPVEHARDLLDTGRNTRTSAPSTPSTLDGHGATQHTPAGPERQAPRARPHPSRPPRWKHERSAPSAELTLLRLVLQHPSAAEQLPAGMIPRNNPEGRALCLLIDAIDTGELTPWTHLAPVVEHFRGHELGELLARTAGEMLDEEFAPELVDDMVAGALQKLHRDAIHQEISSLTVKASHGPLDDTQRERLRTLLIEKHRLTHDQ